VCVYHCAQLSYTTPHRAVLTIFPPNFQAIIRALMLFITGEGVFKCNTCRTRRHPYCNWYKLYKTHCGNCSAASFLFWKTSLKIVWNSL